MNFKAIVLNECGQWIGSKRVNNEAEAFKYANTFGENASILSFYKTYNPLFGNEATLLMKRYTREQDGQWYAEDQQKLQMNVINDYFGCIR